MRNEVAVVLLTWQRVPSLRNTLKRLSVQTYDKFDVYISNGNTAKAAEVEDIAKQLDGELDIWVSHDGNRHFAFRRMFIGRYLAQNNYKKIMFIDDDISFSEQYVDNVLSQWKPKTYKSAYAWDIKGEDYYDRTRVTSPKQRVKYCGTGASLVDSRLFLEDGLVFNYPKQAEKIEDLWMSFYVDHKLRGWKLGYLDCPDIIIGGNDRHALFRDVNNSQYNKTDFLQDLIKMGWRI